ncbi:MAG TPA: hypothetical protein VGI16_03125 [Candidatus Acidoferrum sp.]|jgi:hypothetical protein
MITPEQPALLRHYLRKDFGLGRVKSKCRRGESKAMATKETLLIVWVLATVLATMLTAYIAGHIFSIVENSCVLATAFIANTAQFLFG